MPIHQTICPLKSVNWYKIGTKSERLNATCTKVLARSLQGELENLPINYLFLKRWFTKLHVGSFCTIFVHMHFGFTFIYAFVFKFQIRELIRIIISNYQLVDNWSYDFNQVTSISWYSFFEPIKYISHPLIKLHFV